MFSSLVHAVHTKGKTRTSGDMCLFPDMNFSYLCLLRELLDSCIVAVGAIQFTVITSDTDALC